MLGNENNSEESLDQGENKEPHAEKEMEPVDLVEKDSEELNELAGQAKIMDGVLDKPEIASLESPEESAELTDIKQEEEKEINDWQKTSQEILNGSEMQTASESWRQAAEEQFGISDFSLEKFKRITFNKEAVNDAFMLGENWEYIFDNFDKYKEGESYEEAVEAFKAMQELEGENPGAVKTLHNEYGITNFQRYPKDILTAQLQENDPSKEVGLMAFGREDWNGAFDKQGDVWQKIYDQQKERLNFRVVECDSKMDLARQLIKVKQDFPKKISLGILSAHSNPEGFYLGDDEERGNVSQEEIVESSESLKDLFTDDAQMLANGCSAGALGGWVHDFSKEVKVNSVGPDRPAAIEDVDFLGKDIVPKYYESDINSNYYHGFILSKKSKGK